MDKISRVTECISFYDGLFASSMSDGDKGDERVPGKKEIYCDSDLKI